MFENQSLNFYEPRAERQILYRVQRLDRSDRAQRESSTDISFLTSKTGSIVHRF